MRSLFTHFLGVCLIVITSFQAIMNEKGDGSLLRQRRSVHLQNLHHQSSAHEYLEQEKDLNLWDRLLPFRRRCRTIKVFVISVPVLVVKL
jgi:hypothetical protein